MSVFYIELECYKTALELENVTDVIEGDLVGLSDNASVDCRN